MLNLEAKSGEKHSVSWWSFSRRASSASRRRDEEKRREALGGGRAPTRSFPYARETVDTLLVKGTFPPFMLAPVNFDTLYAEAKQRREAAQANRLTDRRRRQGRRARGNVTRGTPACSMRRTAFPGTRSHPGTGPWPYMDGVSGAHESGRALAGRCV